MYLNRVNKKKGNANDTPHKDSIITNSDAVITFPTTAFYKDYCPSSTYDNIVKHSYYTLAYSEKDEQAAWVAYKLTSAFLNKISRTNNFREDPLVATGSASSADYKGTGYDRGHLAPAAAMSLNKTAMSESFYMSNMSPQVAKFNRGIWKTLESQVRKWVTENDSLFVVSGPVLNHPIDTIGLNKEPYLELITKPLLLLKTLVLKALSLYYLMRNLINLFLFLLPVLIVSKPLLVSIFTVI